MSANPKNLVRQFERRHGCQLQAVLLRTGGPYYLFRDGELYTAQGLKRSLRRARKCWRPTPSAR